MEQHAVGTVLDVKRINTKTGKVFFALKIRKQDGTEMELTSWDADVSKPEMQNALVEFTYESNGKYNNITKGGWSFKTHGGSEAAASAAPATSRDDQIVRQSATYQAVNLYPHFLAQGVVPWKEKSKESKDPAVVMAFIFEIAGMIRNKVLFEDWPELEEELPPAPEDDTPPAE